MAEAVLRDLAGDRFEASSAGLEPTDVHPLTHEVLRERGIETSALRAKGVREFMGKVKVDYAIAVCDPAEMNCPRVVPFALQILQWPFDDPGRVQGDGEFQLAAFRRVRDQIAARIAAWLRGASDR